MAEWASQFEGENGATELVGLAVDSRGDVALAGHVFEDGKRMLSGRKDAIVMKLASRDGENLWTRNIGVAGSHDWSSDVASDSSGNFFVAGQTDGHMYAPVSKAGKDIWVAKLDGEQGDLLWGYQVGSSGQDVASTLAVDGGSGDVVVCGSTTGVSIEGNGPGGSQGTAEDVSGSQGKGDKKKAPFCLKLATGNGQVMWRSQLRGGSNDGFLAAAVDPETGDVFAAGYTNDVLEVGMSDFVAVRLSGRDGKEMWRSTGGGGWTNNMYADAYVKDSACALAVDTRGDVIIAGNTEGALFGSTDAGQDTDAFVAKLNGSDGSGLWGWQKGSSGNDYANSVAVDPHGDVYACGAATADFFDDDVGVGVDGGDESNVDRGVGRRDGDAEGGGGGREGAWPEEDVSAGGSGEEDMFVAKLDGVSGALIWGEKFGSGADDQAVGLVLGPESSSTADVNDPESRKEERTGGNQPLYLTGWTRGALYSSVPARWQDGWAVKLSNPPPRTLGVSGASNNPLPVSGSVPGSAGGDVSDAAQSAVTMELIATVLMMAMMVSAAIGIVLRRASLSGGSLSVLPSKSLQLRRQGMKPVVGGTSKAPDGVELTLLSGKSEDASPAHSRHGGGGGSGSGGGGGGGGGGSRRGVSPQSGQQSTFYL